MNHINSRNIISEPVIHKSLTPFSTQTFDDTHLQLRHAARGFITIGAICRIFHSCRLTVSIVAAKGSLLARLLHLLTTFGWFLLLGVDLNADLRFQGSDNEDLRCNGLEAEQGECVGMSCLNSTMSITNLAPM